MSEQRDPLSHDRWLNVEGVIYTYERETVNGKNVAIVSRMGTTVCVAIIPLGCPEYQVEAVIESKIRGGVEDEDEEPENIRGESDFRGDEIT